MLIDQNLLDFEAAVSGNTRFFYLISLLWTDCSQERVAEQKNIGERSRHEQADWVGRVWTRANDRAFPSHLVALIDAPFARV